MSVHLRLEEAFSEELEKRLLRWESNVVLSLGTVETKTTSLSTGKNHNTDLTFSDKSVTSREVDRLFIGGQFALVDDKILLNNIKRFLGARSLRLLTCLFNCLRSRVHDELLEQVINECHVELRALIEQVSLLNLA